MSISTAIVWFRNDLRLTDNPTLWKAIEDGFNICPLFIYSPEEEGSWAAGAASRWWLHYSLMALKKALAGKGAQLILKKGRASDEILKLAKELSVTAVFWNRRYEPWAQKQEREVADSLKKANVDTTAFDSGLLFNPQKVVTKDGNPYRVFTPFWKTLLALPEPHEPLNEPDAIPTAKVASSSSLPLEELALLPEIDWAGGMRAAWKPGELGAKEQLKRFLSRGLANYQNGRNRPDQEMVSRLSPYLHFGEVSPRTVWHEVKKRKFETSTAKASSDCYLRELVWREFAHHLLFHFPETTDHPLRQEFKQFPWSPKQNSLTAWTKGTTGYPIVDAGMRELWATGWMHNRVRMIVASFLVKDLLIPWQDGARWFWDTLVDADLANNTLGWQWTAGCGADAAPYFRVFNPVLQGEKFDPEGNYVRHWLPELAKLSNTWLHQPWLAPPLELAAAGIELGTSYPLPLVDHSNARRRALAAFETIKTTVEVR